MPLLKSLLTSLLILAVFVPFALMLPLVAVVLCRYDWGVQTVFWAGPWSAAVWTLLASQIVSSRCWLGAEHVRHWRASRGGYLRTVPVACLWTFGGLFFSYLAEFAMLALRQNVEYSAAWLPLGTFSPVAFAIVWCSRG